MSTHTVNRARARALFVSAVQPSDIITATNLRAAVCQAIRRHGSRGCAALVAYEFGEHPDTAPARMRWATAVVDAAFPPHRVPTQRIVRHQPLLTAA